MSPLFPLFHPRSVAVIGASGNPVKMGYQCVLSLKQCAFPGPIYPVHPQEKEILGLPVYREIGQIPGPVDLAMLVIPAAEILPTLEACRKKDTRGIIIITAGFREIDDPKGERRQNELSAFANRHGMKIIGPNTFGVANLHANLNGSFSPIFSRLKKGPITLISQSGGVAHLIVHQALDEGVGLGKIVGLGNRCNVDFADLLPYLAGDRETKCIILFVEGQDDPRELLSAIEKTVPYKPVVVMKSGQFAESAGAARSHTGSLAGRYEIYGGIVSQDPGEKKALEIGAGGIVVSNHAGVVIDYAAHPLEVLPEIKQVIGNRMPIFVDSGIRRGSDVMKALALGADAVLVGWALIMGLAANGSEGVTEIVDILTAELRRIMSVTGCKDLSEIDDNVLVRRDYFI